MLTFTKLSKKSSQVRAFTGLTTPEFIEFARIYQSDWEQHRQAVFMAKASRKRAMGGGRRLKLSAFDDRLLCFMVYTKLYCTYDLIGYLFDCDPATACRTIADVRGVVGDRLLIKREDKSNGGPGGRAAKRIRTIDELLKVYPELEEVLLDATEQKIPRPKNKKKRKAHHSGKKQAFTIMTQILARKDSLVLHVSAPMAGRRHDVTLFKKSAIPNWLAKHKDALLARADGGYEGMDKQYPDSRILTPIKRQRNKPVLTKQELRYNKQHSRQRIPVEHSFGGMKQFQLLGHIYRNQEKHYKQFFVAIASVRNFRLLARAEANQAQTV